MRALQCIPALQKTITIAPSQMTEPVVSHPHQKSFSNCLPLSPMLQFKDYRSGKPSPDHEGEDWEKGFEPSPSGTLRPLSEPLRLASVYAIAHAPYFLLNGWVRLIGYLSE